MLSTSCGSSNESGTARCSPAAAKAASSGFFLEHFRCMTPSPSAVKSTAVSIKKLYRCMAENNRIPMAEYKRIAATINERTPAWQEEYRRASRS
ncbi:MAG: hypothetical protein ACI36Y_03320 [Coriobacteriales bacterium]